MKRLILAALALGLAGCEFKPTQSIPSPRQSGPILPPSRPQEGREILPEPEPTPGPIAEHPIAEAPPKRDLKQEYREQIARQVERRRATRGARNARQWRAIRDRDAAFAAMDRQMQAQMQASQGGIVPGLGGKPVHVNGYYRSDGTYVHSYDRSR